MRPKNVLGALATGIKKCFEFTLCYKNYIFKHVTIVHTKFGGWEMVLNSKKKKKITCNNI